MTVQIKLSEEQDREELKRRALTVSGCFRSGLKDLSIEHDRYLEEALAIEGSPLTLKSAKEE